MHESNEFLLLQQLWGAWSNLYDKAMQLTTPMADIAYIEHWFSRLLTRWVDAELQVLKELKDLTKPKQQVTDAFAALLTSRKQVKSNASSDLDRCACCGEPLTQGIFSERGCLKCATPVTDALMKLVRTSTDRYTPEYVHEIWSSI